MNGHVYRLPDHGKWHDTLDNVEPGARPNRPREPPPGTPSQRRRKRAVARRSREPLAPGGTYFYWCEHCEYCNTPDEGVTARCANHRRTASANRKAKLRNNKPTYATTPATHVLANDQIALLWQRGLALNRARNEYEAALRRGTGLKAKPSLDQAIGGVLEAISSLPRPDLNRKSTDLSLRPGRAQLERK